MHFSVIYFLKIVVDLFVSFGIFFSCLFSLFFFILFRHHPFRNHPFQDLSFSGIILFRTYPFRIFLFRMNPFQELSLTGIFLFRLISFSGTMLFRSYLLQEMVLLQEYARLRVTQRILKYICGEIIQRQKEKTYKGCFLERTIALLMCLLQLYTTAQNEIFHNMRLRLLLPNYIIQG